MEDNTFLRYCPRTTFCPFENNQSILSESEFLSKIEAANGLVSVNCCCSLDMLGRCLQSISVKNNVNALHVSLIDIDETSRTASTEFKVPSNVTLDRFSNLKSLSFYSKSLHKINLSSFGKILKLTGRSLNDLSLHPSCPAGIWEVLSVSTVGLRSLRVDSSRHEDLSTKHVRDQKIFHNLRTLLLSNPDEALAYKSFSFMPALRSLTLNSVEYDAGTLTMLLSMLPACLEDLTIGDSSACASNIVIMAIGSLFPNLKSLTLRSEDRAHYIKEQTFAELTFGCPLLESLDLSAALVRFEDGAIEYLSELTALNQISFCYSESFLERLQIVLADCKSVTFVVFVLTGRDENEPFQALQGLSQLKRTFPNVQFIMQDH